jgi:hypothetical protein
MRVFFPTDDHRQPLDRPECDLESASVMVGRPAADPEALKAARAAAGSTMPPMTTPARRTWT